MINSTYRIADFIADFFAAKGVKNIYSLPGGGAMHLIDAFTKHQAINHISFFHEQGASIAAEAASRTANNEVGVCCVTTGPGATNAITALAGAWIESSPLIVVSGQVKTSDMLRERKLRQTGVQEVQITKLIKPITKYCKVIEDPANLNAILEAAYFHATTGRKGPVWLDVPLDVQGAPIKQFSKTTISTLEPKKRRHNNKISEIFELLKKAERPLFFWGNGINGDNCRTQVSEFINHHRIPSVFTWNASDIIPYENELNMGRPGVVAQRHANFILQKSDLVVAIGTSLDNVITAYNPANFAKNATKVLVNIDQQQLKNCTIPNMIKILASARTFVEDLDNMLKSQSNWSSHIAWITECTSLKRKYENDLPSEVDDQSRLSHRNFILELSEVLQENQLIATGSSGLAIEAFYMMFRNKPGQRYFLTSGLGSMGFGLPQAIGIAIENKNESVVLVESDGSMAMNIQELQTVVNNRLPICIVLMNNNGYASIRHTQSNYFNNRFFGTGDEADQKMPNWKNVTKSYGLNYALVATREQLKTQLQNFNSDSYPMLIDVQLASNERLQPKCAAIPQTDGSIISMPLEDMTPLIPLRELLEVMDGKISEQSKEARL